MLKSILNLKGAQQLEKKEQKQIQGGEFCVIHCGAECYEGHLSAADVDACLRECQRLGDENDRVVGGGF